MNSIPKIAIAHDFFYQNGGAENVVEKLLELYPQAEIYTTIFIASRFGDKPLLQKAFKQNRIKTTWLQALFAVNNNWMLRYFKHFFWLYPLVMRFVNIQNYDAVIISSTDCAKQIRVQNVGKLIHYCHSPTRYLNGLITETDHAQLGTIQKIIIPGFVYFLRMMDHNAVSYLNANNCIWLANSKFIQETIKSVYHIDSNVVYPPVEIHNYLQIERKPELKNEFYLCHGRISFHKRIDLAIMACLKTGRSLKISGTAGLQLQMDQLNKIVRDYVNTNPQSKGLITFLGRTTDEEVKTLMSQCKGFLFPGKEDFGISPIEVLAAGVPIVAFQAGGALEYIADGTNGIFFAEQTVESIVEAINKFESIENWNVEKIKNSSKLYSGEVFLESINKIVGSQPD
jgi:glycosyltransferase involved in cell wall biosynthesis